MNFLETEDVLRVLQGFNPWWAKREAPVPPFRRLAFEACRRHLERPGPRRGILISGPRRVGKTTVLHQLAAELLRSGVDPRALLYLSLDHPVLKLLSLEKILDVYNAEIHPAGSRAFLLLDEVQYAEDWDLYLKVLIDHRPELHIVATGSAALRQKSRLIDSGVGRWVTVPMPTLSFYEFLAIRGELPAGVPRSLRPHDLRTWSRTDLADLAESLRTVLPSFHRYLLVGGFPETALSPDLDYCQRILREDVVERVLKRDIVALFGVRKVADLEKLFIYLCFHSGGVLSVKTCASELGTSAPTVSNHLEVLELANLIYKLPPVDVKGKTPLRQQPKVYLVDAALRNAVLLRGEDLLANPRELGRVVETSVLRHLYAYYYLDSPRVGYWRDSRSGREVDVVVRSPAYQIAVEVKYRHEARLGADSGLAAFLEKEPDVTAAYLVTRQDADFGVTLIPGTQKECLRLPAHLFTYLLGQAEHSLWEGG